ncbi:unnamed protein product [Cylindrotheca closterium]|uniref:LITAF domain-containing protein n=1 Tax=Cylindrotheca closterium TaxID=2856 RepID=A0AAD2CN25_9STRA|nr:unnamed protein product [Cylindrotheca closterium]
MTSNAKTGYAPSYSSEYEVPLMQVNGEATRASSPPSTSSKNKSWAPGSTTSSKNKNFYETERNSTLSGSRRPINLSVCPHCATEHIRTRTRTYPGTATWASVGVSAIVFLPLAVIPLVCDSMKKTDHFCQSCGNKIGTVKPFEGFCVKEAS